MILLCKGKIFLSPNILLSPWLSLAVKTEGKKSFSNCVLSVSSITRAPTSFGSVPTFLLVFLVLLIKVLVIEEVLYAVLTFIITLRSKWTLALLVAFLHTLKIFPYSSCMACPFSPHFSRCTKEHELLSSVAVTKWTFMTESSD